MPMTLEFKLVATSTGHKSASGTGTATTCG
jgi:hypothetical protein